MNIPFSSPISTTTTSVSAANPGTKRPKNHHHHRHEGDQNHDEYQSLLPGLPDHIAQICLSFVPPSLLFSVCRPWRRLIYSPSFPPFLSIYTLLHPSSPPPTAAPPPEFQEPPSNSLYFSSFDPISSTWQSIPQPPLSLILHHPSFISRRLPIQSVTVAGKLALVAATTDHFLPALTRPLIFNPLSKDWIYGPIIEFPRRWCAAGASDGVVYMASGIGSHYNSEVARLFEKWDLEKNPKKLRKQQSWNWEKIKSMSDGKFSREAIDAISWRGKLCMVNVKGRAAKEGIMYNLKDNVWEEMPEGMLYGWRGPAAAMEEESLFMVDEFKGILKEYDQNFDLWKDIYRDKLLKDAQNVAAARGRVCVVCSHGSSILVVDVTVVPPRVRMVETPPGSEAIAIHILPRMSQESSHLVERDSFFYRRV